MISPQKESMMPGLGTTGNSTCTRGGSKEFEGTCTVPPVPNNYGQTLAWCPVVHPLGSDKRCL